MNTDRLIFLFFIFLYFFIFFYIFYIFFIFLIFLYFSVWDLKYLFDPLFYSLLEVLICPKLRSQAKLAVYFSKTGKGLTSSFSLGRSFNKLVVFNYICKNNWFCSLQKENFLSVQSAITPSQSFSGYHNASLLPSPQVSLTVAPFLGTPRKVSVTMPPFPLSPQVSLSDAPFLGAPRRWSVSSSTWWGRSGLGTGLGALPDPVAIPGELVRPSNESSRGLAVPRVGAPVWKRTRNTVRWHACSFTWGFLRSSPAKPPIQRLKGPAWLESHWGLQKCGRNQYSRNHAPHTESWKT